MTVIPVRILLHTSFGSWAPQCACVIQHYHRCNSLTLRCDSNAVVHLQYTGARSVYVHSCVLSCLCRQIDLWSRRASFIFTHPDTVIHEMQSDVIGLHVAISKYWSLKHSFSLSGQVENVNARQMLTAAARDAQGGVLDFHR